jgi:hypothetical protein
MKGQCVCVAGSRLEISASSRQKKNLAANKISPLGNIRFFAVMRIRIFRFHMFLDLPDPDPLVRYTDPDPSIIKKKKFVTSL